MKATRATGGAVALALVLTVAGPATGAEAARQYKCKKGPQFIDPPKRKFHRTEQIQRNENRGSDPIAYEFTSRRSATVKQEVSAGVKVSANAVFASAEASFDVSIAKETTAEIGNSVNGKIKPRHAAVGRYGVYTYVFHGAIYGKADDLEAHRAGWVRITRLEPSDEHIQRFGAVAVVSVRMQMAGSFKGAAFAGPFRYTRVWREAAGGWRVVAGHVSAVAT